MKETSEQFRIFRVFSSHMVLQREREIVFSGRGEKGKHFQAVFAGKTQCGQVGADGIWKAEFPAMDAGGPYTLSAGYTGETPSVELDDILIGEVWMCTGQSNMEMPILSDNPFWRTLNAEEEMKHVDHPKIRLFNSTLTRHLSPDAPDEEESGNGWQVCNAESAAGFSACGYFFGRKIQEDQNVPVGLIATAWGGTDIEAWISAEKYRQMNITIEADLPQDLQTVWNNLKHEGGYQALKNWTDSFDALGKADPASLEPDFDDSAWTNGDKANVVLPVPGRYLCRMNFDLPDTLAGKDLILQMGPVNDCDQTFFNGKPVGATGIETPMYWNAARRYRIPGNQVKAGHNTIAVIADNHFCSGSVSSLEFTLISGENELRIEPQVRYQTVFPVPGNFPKRPPVPDAGNARTKESANYPSTLFNSRLNPWFRYAVRGTIWYQGCNNNGQFKYYLLHTMLIDDLREHWHDPDMPFLLVQLAAFDDHHPEDRTPDEYFDTLPFPEYAPYAITREIQAELPNVRKNVGIVTAFDCGDHSDIHPRDKQTVGKRLAQKAESMLGWNEEIADGPEFIGFRYEADNIRVFFRNTGSGLTTTDGKAPTGFVLGTRDGHFHKAEAKIEGDTVLLSSKQIQHDPQRVRYAFTGYCKVNLINKEGFPALPFRSDKPDYRLVRLD